MIMREITEAHKNSIETVRMRCNHALSSHAFTSLYLWQKNMGLSVICEEDFFVVKSTMGNGDFYFFPCGNNEKMERFIRSKMADKTFSLGYLRECDKKWLEERFPDMWEFRRAEDADEYIGDNTAGAYSHLLRLCGNTGTEPRLRKSGRLQYVPRCDRQHGAYHKGRCPVGNRAG